MALKDEILNRLRASIGREVRGVANSSEEPGLMDKIVDYADRPGAIVRSGIQAYQKDQDPWEAIKRQAVSPSSQAPSGADIAETFGEQQGIQNPMALAALATLADIADPTMFIPGGNVRKAGMAMKALESTKPIAKAFEVGREATGKLGQAYHSLDPAKTAALTQIMKRPDLYSHLPEFQEILKKTGKISQTHPIIPAAIQSIKK